MELLIIILTLLPIFVSGQNISGTDLNPKFDKTIIAVNNDTNKDMYVIHAMVYQIGIITNKTDVTNETDLVGNQEAVTFFHSNGSTIDLGNIPAPLVTNVTAQRMVGVAPAPTAHKDISGSQLHWDDLNNLANSQQHVLRVSANPQEVRRSRDANYDQTDLEASNRYSSDMFPYMERLFKRSLKPDQLKGMSEDDQTPVKIVSGSAVVPQDAELNSIAIPPLLTLNNNFSEIPVPIPNTSVIHYAKVNTLVHSSP